MAINLPLLVNVLFCLFLAFFCLTIDSVYTRTDDSADLLTHCQYNDMKAKAVSRRQMTTQGSGKFSISNDDFSLVTLPFAIDIVKMCVCFTTVPVYLRAIESDHLLYASEVEFIVNLNTSKTSRDLSHLPGSTFEI